MAPYWELWLRKYPYSEMRDSLRSFPTPLFGIRGQAFLAAIGGKSNAYTCNSGFDATYWKLGAYAVALKDQ